jgi:hypothetical protein
MAKATNLQVVGAPEPPAEALLSPARQALAAAIAQRPALTAETEAISAAQGRLASLIVAEGQAAAAVSATESALADRALQWARTANQDPPALAHGADLPEAYEVLRKAQSQAAAARMAEPQLVAEMDRALARRASLEQKVLEHVQAVLAEEAAAIAARINELERRAAAETARLAALRRPLLRLLGQDVMAGRRAVNAIDTMIGERRTVEAEVRALEPAFQRLVDELVAGNAGATMQI